MENIRNYWKLGDFSFMNYSYAYMDHNSYLADKLFVRDNIRLKISGEMASKDSPYHMIFCKVRKKDENKFVEAMEKLKDNMLICGHSDYMEICYYMEKLISKSEKAGDSDE